MSSSSISTFRAPPQRASGFADAYDVEAPSLFDMLTDSEQLSLALEGIGQHYDYVLIDCPPSLGHLTDNALYAA